MFEGIGKAAVDGAIKRIQEIVAGLNPIVITKALQSLSEKIPILRELERGYGAMSDEEKAIFMKNIMLAAAAMAAKSGGRISF